jgi:hypothetical protein
MAKYRSDSGWSDLNELRCLLAYKQLEEASFPRNMLSELARYIAVLSGLDAGSVKAKIGNYKSVAGVTGQSNASKNTKFIYGQYGHLSLGEILELLKNIECSK